MSTELATNASATTNSGAELFELPQNYSMLINKLEQLALGLDSAFANLSLDRHELELAISSGSASGKDGTISFEGGDDPYQQQGQQLFAGAPFASGRAPPPRAIHGHAIIDEVEYSRVVSDIWIGVILTLLIVSVIFFICSCFLYHKFQQWKNSYRTNPNEPAEICRRYPNDYEVESLPSYTIVSGLPTYDDALEEFRKAGIILTPTMTPVVKIFEKDGARDTLGSTYNLDADIGNGDNISLASVCTCGAASTAGATAATVNPSLTPNNSLASLTPSNANGAQIIELSPEQLETLSRKRLSLQIAFNQSVRRQSRPRIDLYREVMHRNNMMRTRPSASHGLCSGHNTINGGGSGSAAGCAMYDALAAAASVNAGTGAFPTIHRSSSSLSLSLANDQRLHMHHLQHRGSLY